MRSHRLRMCVLCLAPLLVAGAVTSAQQMKERGATKTEKVQARENAMVVQYLEIVTPAVEATCQALAEAHGVEFSDPIPEFGNARTANLAGGGRIGVRGPMRETETPVVRPYVLVEDIDAAVKAAVNAGAEVALPPMPIPGQGMFSIYILGGIEHGLWQL